MIWVVISIVANSLTAMAVVPVLFVVANHPRKYRMIWRFFALSMPSCYLNTIWQIHAGGAFFVIFHAATDIFVTHYGIRAWKRRNDDDDEGHRFFRKAKVRFRKFAPSPIKLPSLGGLAPTPA